MEGEFSTRTVHPLGFHFEFSDQPTPSTAFSFPDVAIAGWQVMNVSGCGAMGGLKQQGMLREKDPDASDYEVDGSMVTGDVPATGIEGKSESGGCVFEILKNRWLEK